MKKIATVLVISLAMVGAHTATAQIQKGNLMVGAGLANFDLGLQKGASVGVDLHPRIGYFLADNVAIGALVNFGFNYAKSRGTNINYGINAFSRYYFAKKEVDLIKHAYLFVEGNVGLDGKNTIVTDKPNSATNGLGLGIGPGVAYFLTPNIGLEALAKYNGIVGFGTTSTAHALNVEIGFQIYLTGRKAKAIYKEATGEVKQKVREMEQEQND